MHKLSETWKSVVGFEGVYEVSDRGRVRSLDRTESVKRVRFGKTDQHSRVRLGSLVSINQNRKGYFRLTLWSNGEPHYKVVHQLVLEAFVGRRPNAGSVGRHLDGNCKNNAPSNLAWGTQRDNVLDSMRHRTWVRGETSGMAKLTDDAVRKIRTSSGESQRALAVRFGVSQGAIWQVLHNNNWKHVDA